MVKILNKNKFICGLDGCNNTAIGVGPDNKWICGNCLLKIESKIRKEKREKIKIFIKEIEEENKNGSRS